MKHFALLFRSTRMLSAEEQKQRAADIASWIQHVTDVGIRLDPRSLGEIVGNFYREGSEVLSRAESSDPALTTIVFFDAASPDQAVEMARIHPGMHYGVRVELREWTSPRETTAQG